MWFLGNHQLVDLCTYTSTFSLYSIFIHNNNLIIETKFRKDQSLQNSFLFDPFNAVIIYHYGECIVIEEISIFIFSALEGVSSFMDVPYKFFHTHIFFHFVNILNNSSPIVTVPLQIGIIYQQVVSFLWFWPRNGCFGLVAETMDERYTRFSVDFAAIIFNPFSICIWHKPEKLKHSLSLYQLVLTFSLFQFLFTPKQCHFQCDRLPLLDRYSQSILWYIHHPISWPSVFLVLFFFIFLYWKYFFICIIKKRESHFLQLSFCICLTVNIFSCTNTHSKTVLFFKL